MSDAFGQPQPVADVAFEGSGMNPAKMDEESLRRDRGAYPRAAPNDVITGDSAAKQFVERHGEDLRFSTLQNAWFKWNSRAGPKSRRALRSIGRVSWRAASPKMFPPVSGSKSTRQVLRLWRRKVANNRMWP